MPVTHVVFVFVFLPCCLAGYYGIEAAARKWKGIERLRLKDIFLCMASIGFYACAGIRDAFFLMGYAAVVYLAGRLIADRQERGRRFWLTASVFLVLAALFVYKYAGFVYRVFTGRALGVSIGAPLGISFITFSAISCLADIYRKDAPAGSFLDVALYLTFFPKVSSGPIQLWKDFKGQIIRKVPDSEWVIRSINRIIIGMAKKLILADTFGSVVADIQSNVPFGIDGPTAWGGALLYMLQIYYDFAGYSDIAIGLAGLFGIRVADNFNFPYLSRSITEFWRRWHISLGTWFREYVYIPLGGNRKGTAKTLRNLFLVFLLTGIWHGAGWNYILWGVLNGVCVVAERCIRDKAWYKKTPGWLKWAVTMFLVYVSWIPFRLGSLGEIRQYVSAMLGRAASAQIDLSFAYFFEYKILVLMVIAAAGATVLSWGKLKHLEEKAEQTPVLLVIQEILILVLGAVDVMCIVNSSYSPFLYFQY